MAAAQSARAEQDEIDRLIYGDDPVPVTRVSQPDAVDAVLTDTDESVEPSLPRIGTSAFSSEPSWTDPDEKPAEVAAVPASPVAQSSADQSQPPINAVPEPSAILLALAALGYFLIFGRRRRV